MRIGILTFHRAYNCGAMLQAWGLKKALERMGHEAEFPACNHVGEVPRWQTGLNPNRHGWKRLVSVGGMLVRMACSVPVADMARARHRRFRRMHLPERECAAEELGRHYDALVVGSDQVWNPKCAGKWWPLFLGETWGAGPRAVAYGVSCGDAPLREESLARMREAVGRFDGVSVRESYTRDDLERAGVERGRVAVVADPTVLPTPEDYRGLARGVETPRGPYLFMYSVSLDCRREAEVARGLARRMGLRAVVAPVYQNTCWGAPRGLEYGISPDRLAAYTAGAACVAACSFHGTLLGLLSGKPTISIRTKPDKGRSRPGELLRMLGEEDRLATLDTPLGEMQRVLERGGLPPAARERLAAFRAASLGWLESRLGGREGGGVR